MRLTAADAVRLRAAIDGEPGVALRGPACRTCRRPGRRTPNLHRASGVRRNASRRRTLSGRAAGLVSASRASVSDVWRLALRRAGLGLPCCGRMAGRGLPCVAPSHATPIRRTLQAHGLPAQESPRSPPGGVARTWPRSGAAPPVPRVRPVGLPRWGLGTDGRDPPPRPVRRRPAPHRPRTGRPATGTLTVGGPLRNPRRILEGGVNGAAFLHRVRNRPAPSRWPGQAVVADNRAGHTATGVHAATGAAGRPPGHLPARNPGLVSVERPLSKAGTALRAAAARTPVKLRDAVGDARRTATAEGCRHWCRHCGYDTGRAKCPPAAATDLSGPRAC